MKIFKEILDDVIIRSKGFFQLPKGQTAHRPRQPSAGMLRYNEETETFEGFTKGKWGDVGGSGLIQWSLWSDTVNPLPSGKGQLLDTSAGSLTFKLPTNPSPDDFVWVGDYAGFFATNQCFITGSGKKIMGLGESLELNVSFMSARLTYINDVVGWKITDGVGLGAGPHVFKRQVWPTVAAGSTTISIQYAPGTLDVFKNGRKLQEGRSGADSYTAADGLRIVLNTAALGSDVFEIVQYTRFVITEDKYLSKDDGGAILKHVITNGASGNIIDLGIAGAQVQLNLASSNFFKSQLATPTVLNAPLTSGALAGVWYYYITVTNSATASVQFDSQFKICQGTMDYTLGATNILQIIQDGQGTYDVFINRRGL